MDSQAVTQTCFVDTVTNNLRQQSKRRDNTKQQEETLSAESRSGCRSHAELLVHKKQFELVNKSAKPIIVHRHEK